MQLYLGQIDRVENLAYEPLEAKFIKVQFVSTVLAYLGLMLLPLFLLLADGFVYRYALLIGVECLLLIVGLINLWLLPKAYAYKGFAIREHDITYRSGIVFPSVVTIPFCKIQQVSVRQNPIMRLFGLYAVDVVNGAQMLAETRIPGLTEAKAHEIKMLLTERINHESN